MLKRFMNWLLNKWQGLFGGQGGKRKSAEASLSLRDRALADQQFQASKSHSNQSGQSGNASDAAIPVAERTPFTPLPNRTELSELPQPSLEPVTEPVVAAEPFADDLCNDLEREPDTHQRLDATIAPPPLDFVQPAFPTEVSVLMGSPVQPGDRTHLESPLRTLKKVPEAQLPAIYDLLPATEAADPESELESLPFSQPTSTETGLSPATDNQPVDLSFSSAPSDGLPSSSDQVVLFSFDIVESDEIEEEIDRSESDGLAAETLLVETAPVEIIPAETVSEETAPAETASAHENSGSELLTYESKDSEDSEDISRDSLKEDLTESALLAKAETLPYPWSLPVLEPTVPVAAAIEKEPQTLLALSPPELATDESKAVKNGIVKLLFTLKDGNFHGYIAPDDGTQDILFHQKYINADIFSQLDRGTKVAVSVKYLEGKAYATYIRVL
jgi:cold shock CspA family protein